MPWVNMYFHMGITWLEYQAHLKLGKLMSTLVMVKKNGQAFL